MYYAKEKIKKSTLISIILWKKERVIKYNSIIKIIEIIIIITKNKTLDKSFDYLYKYI